MTKEEHIKHICQKHLGRCLWQQTVKPGGRIMVEFWDYPKAKSYAILLKHFDKALNWRGPYPKVEAFEVFIPVDRDGSWESLDKRLEAYAAGA